MMRIAAIFALIVCSLNLGVAIGGLLYSPSECAVYARHNVAGWLCATILVSAWLHATQ